MNRFVGAALALALLLPAAPARALETDVRTLEPRPGVTVSFLLLQPEGSPVASVILFSGGDGVINIKNARNPRWGRGNFLVRTRELFAGEGLLVAVPEVPSDHATGYGRFRASKDHAADVAAMIASLKMVAPVPVWLVGTSRGTVSAAFVAARLRQGGPDGLVLTSTVTERSRVVTDTVVDADLGQIRVPTLIVHHKLDNCVVTKYDIARLLARGFKNALRAEFVAFEGGVSVGDPCEAFAYHGYNGIEAEVVRTIAAWIKAN
ncbi:MAG: alpha/beta hydrolase [Candidatus Rokuibacteriota bacterium]